MIFATVAILILLSQILQVFLLIRGQRMLSANLKQLTEEIQNMSSNVLISAQALADLQAADTNLQTTVTAVLTEISSQLGSMPPDDSTQVEAVVANIQGQIASLTAAITPATPPASTPTPAPSAIPAG